MEDPNFWHNKWETNIIGFHQDSYHNALVKYWSDFNLNNGSGVLVPLCGKTSDMIWLAEQSYRVIGVELSAIAAKDFFVENNIPYEMSTTGQFQKYQGGNITILVGDFFDLTRADIPNVKAVYDRAALIALPDEMRARYTGHLETILSRGTHILLITLAYNQSQMDGPPFSVTGKEVNTAFGTWCEIKQLDTAPPEDFRGIEAVESVYGLRAK
ncbi:MAG: thiopurine S-methyltransferase [Robiginitomaculum sp.]|nr:thiopurine S-methyltransferase [Robiginitomaculum sp.]